MLYHAVEHFEPMEKSGNPVEGALTASHKKEQSRMTFLRQQEQRIRKRGEQLYQPRGADDTEILEIWC